MYPKFASSHVDVFLLLVITLGFLLCLAKLAKARFIDFPTATPSEKDFADPMQQLYMTAQALMEENNPDAAAAMARLVAADTSNLTRSLSAARLAGKSELQQGKTSQAKVDFLQGLNSIANSHEKQTPELRYLHLLLLGELANIYIKENNDDPAWSTLEQARQLAESEKSALHDPSFRRNVLAPLYHNLGIYNERGRDWFQSAKYYELAAEIWQDLPEDQNQLSVCRDAYLHCARHAAEKMFG